MLPDLAALSVQQQAELASRTRVTPNGITYIVKQRTPKAKKAIKPLPLSFAQFSNPTPTYFEEDGLRKVRPYTNAFSSFIKERWLNRTLIDV